MSATVNNKASLIQKLSANTMQIKGFGVKQIGFFGSFAKDININSNSDVDFLVEFEPEKKTFDNFINLAFYLEDLLGRKIELVTRKSLSKYIGQYILNEVENVSL